MTKPPANYYANVNTDLLALLPLSAKNVLELGCGTGALGAAFKQRQPRTCWQGIELDPASAQTARGVLDAVLNAEIEHIGDYALDRFITQAPDTLVFGDVLEHLHDPLHTLRRMVDRLAPGGTVVACIPNVSH
jgi:trans-aconitate methyltransferase